MGYVNYTDAEKTAQETRCLELRLLGKTYEYIGNELGISHQTAFTRTKNALARYAAPKAEEVRTQETARLQMTIDAAVAVATADDARPADRINAIKAIQHASDLIARMHGSFAPVKVEAQVTEVTQADLEIQEMIREARAHAAVAESAADTAAPA